MAMVVTRATGGPYTTTAISKTMGSVCPQEGRTMNVVTGPASGAVWLATAMWHAATGPQNPKGWIFFGGLFLCCAVAAAAARIKEKR